MRGGFSLWREGEGWLLPVEEGEVDCDNLAME